MKILFIFRVFMDIFNKKRKIRIVYDASGLLLQVFFKNCLEININHKFYQFLTMAILQYLFFLIKHYNFTVFIVFVNFFRSFTYLFSSKSIKIIQTIKHNYVFLLYDSVNSDSFVSAKHQ